MSQASFSTTTTRGVSTAGLKQTLAVGGSEAWRLVRAGLRALLLERAPLAGLFLLCAWPWLVVVHVRGVRSGAAQKEKTSPFIYTMQ